MMKIKEFAICAEFLFERSLNSNNIVDNQLIL